MAHNRNNWILFHGDDREDVRFTIVTDESGIPEWVELSVEDSYSHSRYGGFCGRCRRALHAFFASPNARFTITKSDMAALLSNIEDCLLLLKRVSDKSTG